MDGSMMHRGPTFSGEGAHVFFWGGPRFVFWGALYVVMGHAIHHSTAHTPLPPCRGRAGRVQPGVCYHLFPQPLFDRFQQHDMPEMLRTPLLELYMLVKLLGFEGAGRHGHGLVEGGARHARDAAHPPHGAVPAQLRAWAGLVRGGRGAGGGRKWFVESGGVGKHDWVEEEGTFLFRAAK